MNLKVSKGMMRNKFILQLLNFAYGHKLMNFQELHNVCHAISIFPFNIFSKNFRKPFERVSQDQLTIFKSSQISLWKL